MGLGTQSLVVLGSGHRGGYQPAGQPRKESQLLEVFEGKVAEGTE